MQGKFKLWCCKCLRPLSLPSQLTLESPCLLHITLTFPYFSLGIKAGICKPSAQKLILLGPGTGERPVLSLTVGCVWCFSVRRGRCWLSARAPPAHADPRGRAVPAAPQLTAHSSQLLLAACGSGVALPETRAPRQRKPGPAPGHSPETPLHPRLGSRNTKGKSNPCASFKYADRRGVNSFLIGLTTHPSNQV